MQVPLIPFDETERLRKLESLRLPYSPIEERFEQVTRLAQSAFEVRVCLISLIGSDYQWFKSAQGICIPETSRSISFCGHTILGPDVFIIEDATRDPRFADNPLVTEAPHIRFYAGFPLHAGDGTALGTLCLVDTEPRHLMPREIQLLRSFGNWANFQVLSTVEDLLHATYLSSLDETARRNAIDPLTRVWTHESLRNLFQQNLKLADMVPTPYTLLQVGIDDFEQHRDRYPSDVVEHLLWDLARRIHGQLLPGDLLGHGGDGEFLVCLREARATSPMALAALICEAVAEEPVQVDGNTLHARCSIGIAPIQTIANPEFETVLEIASTALGHSRETGQPVVIQSS